jgi:para-aminobenzoate synthetase/4-amino-4-deoxychorismate lyase
VVHLVFDFDPFGHLEFTEPRAVIAAESLGDVRAALRAAEAAAAEGRWAAGFVAYEAAPAFDPALRVHRPVRGPLAWFGMFDHPEESEARPVASARFLAIEPDVSRDEHSIAVEAVRAALGRGAAYQVNLTFRLRGRFEGDPLALYQRLRAAQGGRYGALLRLGNRAIVSASPELFFQRRGDLLTARPMKGTARRGRFAEEDDRAAAALAASEKDRAENVMIADLMRNDVGRVARAGTVRVAELCAVERYRTILQMTSTVEGRLLPGVSLDGVFAALFPCGSVTGAPKISAMGLIADLERSPRGAYCGAVGVVAPGGDASFNVAIRTLDIDLDTGLAAYGTGGGITWLSSPEGEWDEALAKAAVLSEADPTFRLVETMRLEGGVCQRLERHLARLESSARYLGFPFDPTRVRHAIEREARVWPAEGRRLRLLLSAAGNASVETSPLPPPATEPLAVALARAPVSSQDWLLFHKTTRRETYEARRRERPDMFDVVLQNEKGELTEFTIGNLVVEIGGERLTPPREAGLLAGVFRGELLARGEIREQPLRPRDLRKIQRLWLVNSLRGWVPVRLVG